MLRFIFGVFVVLHGLVYLLYAGQSWRLFTLQPGMVWPDGSWALSTLLGDGTARVLVSVACAVAALGFVAGGAGVLVRQAWWRPVILAVAAFSTLLIILAWDGTMRKLADQGGIGLLINVALLVAAGVLRWPDLGL